MVFIALASDYDGTLAHDGQADAAALEALRRLKTTGKKLLLVTGRELPDLRRVFTRLYLFDVVVAENGAVLFLPQTAEERAIAPEPPEAFVAALRARGVAPLSVGRGIVATWEPNQAIVLDVIRELGLEWQVIFNKGAVMCLAPGVNKASGLAAALVELKLSPHNVVAVGDAENDHAFLTACGCAVAVANALDSVKADADIVTRADHGAGVAELIGRWLDDPVGTFAGIRRHDLYLGDAVADGAKVHLAPDAGAVLIAGASGIGKSRLATLLLERIVDGSYQAVVVDPEGDYDNLADLAHIGGPKQPPAAAEAVGLLRNPGTSVALNLLGIGVEDRPAFFSGLMGQLSALRADTGRPHWLMLDETHHLLPAALDAQSAALPADLPAAIFITLGPDLLSPAALDLVQTMIAVGDQAAETIAQFCALVGEPAPDGQPKPGDAEVLVWRRGTGEQLRRVRVGKARQEHQRHTRKYAKGRLGEDKSFYFRGPQQALNLRAHNLASFLELARGVDDATWLHHLHRGDYTRWFRDAIGDEEMAQEAAGLESERDAGKGRAAMAEIINRRYAAVTAD